MEVKNTQNNLLEFKNNDVCQLCKKIQSKYACPRCNILYCSLSCYRSENHSNCSEVFYKECVQEELKSISLDPTSRNKMKALLENNFKQESSEELDDFQYSDDGSDLDQSNDDDADDCGLTEQDLEKDHSELWQCLSPEQREEFKEMLKSGRILDVVPEFVPWWLSGDELPELIPDIPDITSLTSRPITSSMPYIIMNALMAYQITQRSLKAEKYYYAEAAIGIFNLSAALRGDIEVNSLEDSILLIIKDLPQCAWANETSENCIKKDLRDLALTNSDYLLRALSDLKGIYDYSSVNNNVKERFTGTPPKTKILKQISKKIVFYLAYVKSIESAEWVGILGT